MGAALINGACLLWKKRIDSRSAGLLIGQKMAKIYTGSYVEDELNVVSSVLSSVVPILLMTTMTFPCMESHLWFDLKGF